MQTKVSLIVPCYNKVKWIGEMLESVCNQIWDNVEVVLINDGSMDGTRDIIGEWEPKLKQRGFEVIIVDQENQGVGLAVYNGLIRANGTYICFADCDDILHPEFISARAEALDKYPDYDLAVCNASTSLWDWENGPFFKNASNNNAELSFLNGKELYMSFITRRCNYGVWCVMSRKSYMDKCGLIKNYYKNRSTTQETQIWAPLAFGKGTLIHVHKCLYTYRHEAIGSIDFADYKQFIAHCQRKFEIAAYYARNSDLPTDEKRHALEVLKLMGPLDSIIFLFKKFTYRSDMDPFLEKIAKEISELVNKIFDLPHEITPGIVLKYFYPLYRAITNNLIKYDNPFLKSKLLNENPKRVIAWGVLGHEGYWRLPQLKGTPLSPDILWDISAKDGLSYMDEIPITRPQPEIITKDDIVLSFPLSLKAAKSIYETLSKSNAGSILYHFDMLDYLAAYHFPQIHTAERKMVL